MENKDSPRPIVIVGSSGHAKVIIDMVNLQGGCHIVGLLDRFREKGTEALGYPILGKEEDLAELSAREKVEGVIIAIGDNFVRKTVAEQIKASHPSIRFPHVVHPRATVADGVMIGEGSVVMAGAVVNPGAAVGNFCIVNTNASLDHDSILEDYASLAPGVNVGGGCRIGRASAIGIGAAVIHGITIGDDAIIGAGAVVVTSIPPRVVAYGSPAKEVRARIAGKKYL